MLVHCRVTPGIKCAGTHLLTWVERGTVRVNCHAQEQQHCSQSGLESGLLDIMQASYHKTTAFPC